MELFNKAYQYLLSHVYDEPVKHKYTYSLSVYHNSMWAYDMNTSVSSHDMSIIKKLSLEYVNRQSFKDDLALLGLTNNLTINIYITKTNPNITYKLVDEIAIPVYAENPVKYDWSDNIVAQILNKAYLPNVVFDSEFV